MEIQVDEMRFYSFQYPLLDDIEWALEFARVIEKYLGRNSQKFTTALDGSGQLRIDGFDFVGFQNYSWDPELRGLSQDLKKYYHHRLQSSLSKNKDFRAES